MASDCSEGFGGRDVWCAHCGTGYQLTDTSGCPECGHESFKLYEHSGSLKYRLKIGLKEALMIE